MCGRDCLGVLGLCALQPVVCIGPGSVEVACGRRVAVLRLGNRVGLGARDPPANVFSTSFIAASVICNTSAL